jgi:hypothetical protein
MFRKLFGRKPETNLEVTKVELMTDLLTGLHQTYVMHAAIAWKNIEETGDEELMHTATLAISAFDVGFYGMAAAYLKAQSLEADFKGHPELVDFGLEVVRQAFLREYDEEIAATLTPTVMDIVGKPEHELYSHVAQAYQVGQHEAFNAARSVMDEDFNSIGFDVLKQVFVAIMNER